MNQLFNNINFYPNKIPQINENVLVVFNEYKNTHIEATLLEYININGLMIYEDATRKKKIYDWKKEIPLDKIMVAKVEEIYEDNYIKLSTAYFDHRKDPDELKKELMKPFNDNKILVNIIKKFCYNKIDFEYFWKDIIYKIIIKRNEEDFNMSLFDYFLENLNYIKELILSNNFYSILNINDLDKLVNIKNYKLETKISLITKNSINDIMNLLNKLYDEINNFEYNIKYISTPYYTITSNNNCSSEEDHNKIIDFINNNKNNIMFKVEYLAKKI